MYTIYGTTDNYSRLIVNGEELTILMRDNSTIALPFSKSQLLALVPGKHPFNDWVVSILTSWNLGLYQGDELMYSTTPAWRKEMSTQKKPEDDGDKVYLNTKKKGAQEDEEEDDYSAAVRSGCNMYLDPNGNWVDLRE